MDKRGSVISFLNMKGGVGKTTLCKEMALFLSEFGEDKKKILVIDIDPQSNCTQSFFEKYNIMQIDDSLFEKDKLPSISKVFSSSVTRQSNLDEVIIKLTDTLHLLPGDLDTVFMERETSTGAAEQKLLNFILENKLKEKYDYIFIDCPPTYSFYTVSALLSSDYYFVPVKPDAYSVLGLDLLERVVRELKNGYRIFFQQKPITNLGVIFTMVGGTSIQGFRRNIDSIKKSFADKDIYFFRNEFRKIDRLATGKLSTFIVDRDDSLLLDDVRSICMEFEERVVGLGES
ncbi:AAA family ATPase [Paenibacillus faecis]|uniref:AAA family ATPase n=1 Tax=Paenibacillus faecis TaxID=862114 RepID=A0A5D0CPZ8_9BACL|nr:AAA family ATPase [Paenibacillus faecis]TYA11245.1 AAA family ATPase [Paenibacillus faecis]